MDNLPFTMTDEVQAFLLDAVTHPPTFDQQAALVWSSQLAYIDEDYPNDLSLGSGFCVQFHPVGSQSPDSSFHQLAPSCCLFISQRSLAQLCGRQLRFVTRHVNLRAGRSKAVRVLVADSA